MSTSSHDPDFIRNLAWWKYPMKPVRVPESVLAAWDMSKYVMERKYDGHRAILIVHGRPVLWTRERRRIDVPREMEERLAVLRLPQGTVLDGEIWHPTKRGGWKQTEGAECRLTFWDCVKSGTKNMSNSPLEERRDALLSLIGDSEGVSVVESLQASAGVLDRIRREAAEARETACLRSGFVHGVVLKRIGSPRRDHATRSAEHPDWLKIVFKGMSGWAPR
jgi:ATP-dependent DNA ligase